LSYQHQTWQTYKYNCPTRIDPEVKKVKGKNHMIIKMRCKHETARLLKFSSLTL